MKKHEKNKTSQKDTKEEFPGYPLYPASDDIYSRAKEETELDPEQPNIKKVPVDENSTLNEKNFKQAMSGSDLDIPGAEIDDEQEDIGSEDEENNLYSLGGEKD